LQFSDLRHALAEAEYHRLVDSRDVADILGRGHPGSAALRRALTRHNPRLARTRSHLERAFLTRCEKAGIPQPDVNIKIEGLTVDAVWRERGLVVELDGEEGHESQHAVARDRRRELILRKAGFRIVRYSYNQVTEEPIAVEADLRSALALSPIDGP
jgi:very-short-patch-repair endonuclease